MACFIFNSLDIWETILQEDEDIFAQYKRQQRGRKTEIAYSQTKGSLKNDNFSILFSLSS